jgi:choline dehydrogenase-like flavoprotein
MLLEQPQQLQGSARDADVCIVGSGPAGMTLALDLERKGFRVLVLEAGEEHYSEASQSHYAGRVIGDQHFDIGVNRLRFFGGSSNHWGGFCRTLDDWDFRDKVDGVPGAWPISRKDLDPHLPRASEILELPRFPADRRLDDQVMQVHWTYAPLGGFGQKYRAHVKASRTLNVVLNASVTNLVERGGRIAEVEVSDPSGQRGIVRARHVVLCAGGIENSRLLLWANVKNEGRVVRQPRALGKYWMEHPHYTVGDALISVDPRIDPDRRGRAYIAPTERAIRERRIMNCALRLERTDYDGTKQLIADLACVAPRLGRWAIERAGKRLVCGARLRAAWEQSPRESNQVRLAERCDAFGIPLVDLHWSLSDLEKHTVRQTALMFGEYLAAKGYGRVRLLPWLDDKDGVFPIDDELIGNHHLGGTRMSADPATGVVDADCRVHGMANLYVCGSSVFPSGGHANPTLTIVQLAVRLAAHLGRRGSAGALT